MWFWYHAMWGVQSVPISSPHFLVEKEFSFSEKARVQYSVFH